MNARLVFVSGRRTGASVELGQGRTTIGRNPTSDIRFPPDEVLVSADHAFVERRGDEFVLTDTASRNGTFVNEERIEGDVVLGEGDVIRFGSRGPTVQFVSSSGDFVAQTVDATDKPDAVNLFREAQKRASERHSGDTAIARGFSTTREFAAMAIQRSSRRAKSTTIVLGFLMLAVVVALNLWQERSRAQLQSTLDQIAMQLQAERGQRSILEQSLETIQSNYDSMLGEVESTRRQLDETRRSSAGLPESVTRSYSNGVALLVFSYGFAKPGTDTFLRFQIDRNGQPTMERGPTGQMFPRIGFGGDGPPLARHGSATGFLIDSAGWLVTNRHVALPWERDDDLQFLENSGLDVEPRFIVLEAYFPPGGGAHDLTVFRASDDVDLAILRTVDRTGISAPVIPLGNPPARAVPGEQIVFIGYPTGVHNLLFRIPESERTAILESTGQDPVPLARELAQRDLIQPLVIGGSISDTTRTEIIHTAGTTGGGSGGPLIGADRTVVGIHYAAVRSPIVGDPFQTQRAVKVAFVLDVLPEAIRNREGG
jgi:S1-C subfamily serine protease